MIFDSRHVSTESDLFHALSGRGACSKNHLAFCIVNWMARAANGETIELLYFDNRTTMKIILSIDGGR